VRRVPLVASSNLGKESVAASKKNKKQTNYRTLTANSHLFSVDKPAQQPMKPDADKNMKSGTEAAKPSPKQDSLSLSVNKETAKPGSQGINYILSHTWSRLTGAGVYRGVAKNAKFGVFREIWCFPRNNAKFAICHEISRYFLFNSRKIFQK
jgi:hypothetical protein